MTCFDLSVGWSEQSPVRIIRGLYAYSRTQYDLQHGSAWTHELKDGAWLQLALISATKMHLLIWDHPRVR